METVVSGARPTGGLQIGNYFGAIRNFVQMQEEFDKCYFFVADYHSLTTHPEAKELNYHVKELLATYLACGLDPEKATIYIQSHLPQIPELYLLFNMFAYKGELEKVPTFKEKVRSQTESGKSVNAGLLTYPVLMSVDILIHRALKVPVGKDQLAHIEMARDYAKRFNYMTKSEYFPEPVGFSYTKELIKVPALDGSGKMSKSAANPNSAIFLMDEDKVLRKKIMRATTDSGPTEENQAKPEVIENLFDLMRLVSTEDVVCHYESAYNDCSIRYGDMKKQLAEDMAQLVNPIRERIKDLIKDETYLAKVVKDGGEQARESAAKTLKGAKELMGMNYFG